MYEDNRFKDKVRITKDNLEWIKKNKQDKSAAAFLDQIINEYRQGYEMVQPKK